jgi:hypothetical protein
VCPEAIALALDGGALALQGSVFDRVPGAGDWRGILLLDGSIGIGGDPIALRRRVAALLHPAGDVWVELDPPGTPCAPVAARLEGPTGVSTAFSWPRLTPRALEAAARRAGLNIAETWMAERRPLARLTRA